MRTTPLLVTLLALAAVHVASAKEGWSSDFASAKREAAEGGKRMVVDFYADWCGPCKALENTTFRNPEVVKALLEFVPVRVNVDREPELVASYGVRALPTLAVLEADGTVVRKRIGFMEAKGFLEWLNGTDGPAAQPSEGKGPETPTWVFDAKDPQATTAKIEEMAKEIRGDDPESRKPVESALRQLARDNPAQLVPSLSSPKLLVRVLAHNALVVRFGSQVDYDPWSDSATREAAAVRVQDMITRAAP